MPQGPAFGQRHKILKEVRNLKSLNIVENIAASQEFSCEVCKEIFPSVEELGTHVQSHTAEALASIHEAEYACTFCNHTFITLTELNNHVLQSHTSQAEKSRYAGGNLFNDDMPIPIFSMENSDFHNIAESTQVMNVTPISVLNKEMSIN